MITITIAQWIITIFLIEKNLSLLLLHTRLVIIEAKFRNDSNFLVREIGKGRRRMWKNVAWK